MAVQNGAARLLLGTVTPTTVMTGNVTQLVLDAADLARAGTGAGARAAARGRAGRMLPPVLAFVAGAAAGAACYAFSGFRSLLVPLLAVLAGVPAAGRAA